MTTVSVGIAAYNAEKNIVRLVRDVLSQREHNFSLAEVLVHVDRGTDKTAEAARSVGDSRVRVLEATERQGFAGSVKRLLQESNGDVVVLLNDDIVLEEPNQLLRRIVDSFCSDQKIGFACGAHVPFPPENFVQAVSDAGFRWFDDIRRSLPNGGGKLSVDGKVMVLSREFIDSLQLPDDTSRMGNADNYLYFSARSLGFSYRWMPEVVSRYPNPATWSDFFRWHGRNHTGRYLMAETFGQAAVAEYRAPASVKWRYFFKHLLRRPLHLALLVFLSKYLEYQGRARAKSFNPTWDPVLTTRNHKSLRS